MVDIHDRGPVVPEDAWRWMELETSVEEAAHIAQSRSLLTEEFVWWKVGRAVNRADPNNNGGAFVGADKRERPKQECLFPVNRTKLINGTEKARGQPRKKAVLPGLPANAIKADLHLTLLPQLATLC